ncbi:MAG: GNAT family N-acetyltransferase [Thermotogaceae bacterium]|nr:GNAT family N-acetyltransferase [Thermotogaceae bacterium]
MPIRRLEKHKHVDQVIQCLEQAFQYPFCQLQQRFWLDEESNWQWIWGMEDEGKIVGTYVSFEVQVCLRGKAFQGHYLDALATLPNYRNRGWIKEMMLRDFQDCRENKVPVILLDPFKHAYYRKYGFETIADCKSLTIPWNLLSDSFPKNLDSEGLTVYLGKLSVDEYAQKTYAEIHRRAFENPYYSEMIRPPSYEKAVFMDRNLWIAFALDHEKTPQGYLLFYIENRILHITRMKFFTLRAFYAFKKLILQNRDQVRTVKLTRIPADFPVDRLVHSYWQNGEKMEWTEMSSRMMRVVDIPGLLSTLKDPGELAGCPFGITDPWLETPEPYRLSPEKWSMNVTTLAQLAAGSRSAAHLYRQGYLLKPGETEDETEDRLWESADLPEYVKELDRLFPPLTPFQTENW